MTGPRQTVAEMRSVRKEFPGPVRPLRLFDDVNLAIHERDFVVITGPSGSGKSTLLHLLGLLEPVSAGEVLIDGRPTAALRERERCICRSEKLGMVFQRFHLLAGRTALENVRFRFRYLADPPRDPDTPAREALARVGLADLADKPAGLLSGGEMQRVAIARALAWPPRLLLADEPTGNLDAASAGGVMAALREIHARGVTIALVTHNPAWLDTATRHWRLRDAGVEESA